jgi:catechol 2,3-dioxygenase-like lactoylglutathione lyase family enzyme
MTENRFPAPNQGILLTQFIIVSDIARSRDFYADVLGGEAVMDGDQEQGIPAMVKLANAWIIINVGGCPTEDKPQVTLKTPDDLVSRSRTRRPGHRPLASRWRRRSRRSWRR